MTLAQMIAQQRAALSALLAERSTLTDQIRALATDPNATAERVLTASDARKAKDAEIDVSTARLDELEAEQVREDALSALQARTGSTVPGPQERTERVSVTSEERTYAPHKERAFDASTGKFRARAKPGAEFERDIIGAFVLGDFEAQERLRRHAAEERVEKAEYMTRAAGTGAFAGLTVPQYLTDLYAPKVAARRPFADAMNQHELPAEGMTVNISQITTATSVADQATENTAVSETDIDDTLLTISVRTAAGQQTLSRQAITRSTGVEPIVLDDLYRRYATNLDGNILNLATFGLSAVATSNAYTDATPTVPELYPKILGALSGVEAALLSEASGENLAVMHSRRWYWLQSQLSATFPIIGQPGLGVYQGGVNNAVGYGDGFRGVLPNGTPVVVDNNIATTVGAGTEDEIYFVDRYETHLWEDPAAPMFIRAEQTKAASLGILLVVWGYYAFTHTRLPHAQKINGTGLIAPTF